MLNILQDLLENVFEWMFGWIIGPFEGLKNFGQLIYGEGETLVYGTFKVDEINNIYVPGVTTMFYLVGFALLIAIIMTGMRISSTSINPSNRTYVITFFRDLLIVTILLFNLETLYQIIFSVNHAIVKQFTPENADVVGSLRDFFDHVKDNGILGGLIITLFMLGLSFWANFYYIMRKLTLLIFMILGPLMVTLYLIPQTKQITSAWFKEFVGTVFVQSIHAVLYWMISLMSDGASTLATLMIHIVFIPLAESLRSLIGLGGGMTGHLARIGSMWGLTGLAALGGAVKSAFEGKSVTSALRGGWEQLKNRKSGNQQSDGFDEDGDTKGSALTTLSNAGTDTGATPAADRMLTAGQIMSKTGKAFFGAAGAIAGTPLGPIGAIALAQTGSTLGGAAGGLAGRSAGTALNIGEKGLQHIKNAFNAGKETFDEKMNAENLADEELANEMADKWTMAWADENKGDFEKRWSDLSDEDKEKAWQEVLAGKRAENLKKARKLLGDIKHGKGNYANASELIDSTVDELTTSWANENKEKFMDEYDAKNPLPENATKEQFKAHEANREAAWQKALNEKRAAIHDAAVRSTGILPTQLTNNTPIKVADFAKKLGKELQSQLGLDSAQIEDSVKQLHSKSATTANAKSLVDTTVDKLTNDWAGENREKFMQEYDAKNPLPENATEEQIQAHHANREAAWRKAVNNTRSAIRDAVVRSTGMNRSSSAYGDTPVEVKGFAENLGKELQSELGMDAESITQKVTQIHQRGRSTFANAKSLVDTTVDKLTNDWANNNKAQFFKEYDQQHSVPTGATERAQYIKQREQAWQQAVQAKRQEIASVVEGTAQEMSYRSGLENSFISKENFAQRVGTQVAGIIGKSGNEATQMVENATSAVKNASIYSGRTLNRNFMTNRIASIKTEEAKQQFVNETLGSGRFATAEEASNYFDQHEAPKVFERQLNLAQQEILPNTVQLSREVPEGPPSKTSAFVSGVATGTATALGIPQMVRHFRPLAAGFKADPSANFKKKFSNALNAYFSTNAIQKQAAFRDSIAYIGGFIGGVRGYKAGSHIAGGGIGSENADGSFSFRLNPFNKAANQQIAEISEIEQMVQKEAVYDGDGQVVGYEIPDGAIRMATTRNETVIQVKDKTGNYRTVSRLGSGDSTLKQGNTIYQNLTIKDRQFVPTSGVYREDSGGGRIALNRTINVDPNKLVANRTVRQEAQISIKAPPAYSQFVDSREYNLDQIIKDGIENITMVIDRRHSYLVGTKDGVQYRISAYGPGDTRLQNNQVVYQVCQPRNKRLVVSETYTQYGNGSPEEFNYTSTYKPTDLLPKITNRRNQMRKELDKFRNRALTEPLR